jgi:hypothetical protein
MLLAWQLIAGVFLVLPLFVLLIFLLLFVYFFYEFMGVVHSEEGLLEW